MSAREKCSPRSRATLIGLNQTQNGHRLFFTGAERSLRWLRRYGQSQIKGEASPHWSRRRPYAAAKRWWHSAPSLQAAQPKGRRKSARRDRSASPACQRRRQARRVELRELAPDLRDLSADRRTLLRRSRVALLPKRD